jgi:hypothetical protein
LPRSAGARRREDGVEDRQVASATGEFAGLTDRSALVLAIDDMQWGDLDSAMLLGELAPRIRRLLLIARPEEAETPWSHTCDRAGSGASTSIAADGPMSPNWRDACIRRRHRSRPTASRGLPRMPVEIRSLFAKCSTPGRTLMPVMMRWPP